MRALFVLIEGMKKHPDDEEAMDLLLDWYGVKYPRAGLEADVVDVLELQPDADDLLSTLVDNLRHGGHDRIASSLLARGEKRGLRYIPPESPPAEGEAAEPDDAGLDADGAYPVGDIDAVAEFEQGADDFGTSTDEETPSASSGKRAPSPRKTSKKKRRRIRLRWVLVAVLAAVALAIGGINAWQAGQRAAALSEIDIAFETLDPLAPQPWSEAVADAVRRWPRDEELQEREAFMHVFLAENVDDIPPLDDASVTRWGLAANVLASVQRHDLESALRNVKRHELLYPDEAMTDWLRAVVEESRGALSEADESAQLAIRKMPSFVPAHITRVHVAIRRGDAAGVSESLGTLKQLDDDHPYLTLETLRFPTTADLFGPITIDGEFEPSEVPQEADHAGRFLAGARALNAALQAFRAGRPAVALAAAETSAKLAPGVASTELLLAVVRAHAGEVEGAAGALTRFAELEGVDPSLRTLMQAAGTLALARGGRPDLAKPFLASFGRSTTKEERARLVGSFRAPPQEGAGDAYGWAIYARAVVLAEGGAVDRAVEVCDEAVERGILADDFSHLRHVLQEATAHSKRSPRPAEGDARTTWEIVRAYYRGDHARVVELSEGLKSPVARGRVLRFVVLSHLALRRLGPALVALDTAEVSFSEAVGLQGARLRAFSRLPRGARRYKDLRSELATGAPTGITRSVDLAFAAFWQGDATEATRLVDQALVADEDHRQANWLKGLLLRARGRFNDAKPFLQKSGKDYDSNPEVLLELGNVNSELGNWDEARKMYYQALLRDRHSLDALNGLGKAYTHISKAIGQRDLERIFLGYPATSKFSAQRGEALKWLAVIHGAPDGAEAALSYLDTAESLIGRRGDLLVVRAQYHEALNETAEARKLYAQALQRNSTMGDAHLGLARTALVEKDLKVARDHLRRYLELEPAGTERDWVEKKLAELQ